MGIRRTQHLESDKDSVWISNINDPQEPNYTEVVVSDVGDFSLSKSDFSLPLLEQRGDIEPSLEAQADQDNSNAVIKELETLYSQNVYPYYDEVARQPQTVVSQRRQIRSRSEEQPTTPTKRRKKSHSYYRKAYLHSRKNKCTKFLQNLKRRQAKTFRKLRAKGESRLVEGCSTLTRSAAFTEAKGSISKK